MSGAINSGPQSPERTLILCAWFFHLESFNFARLSPNDAIEFWDMTNETGLHVCG